jgi:hypothetical protein
MAKEQFRETRLVIITPGRFAIRLNPLRMLRAERIVDLPLKLGVTRNFSDGDFEALMFHQRTKIA